MRKIVFGVTLISIGLSTSCMQRDKRLTIMNSSNETVRVVVNLENGEFHPGVRVSRIEHKDRPFLLEYDLGYRQDWGKNPLEQFEVHPGKFKMGLFENSKKEENDRKIKEDAMLGRLDFYKDEILIGSFFIGNKDNSHIWSFDVDNPKARFAVSEKANIFLRHIWWPSREAGNVIRIRPYDPKYRYPNSGEIELIVDDQSPVYHDDPNDTRSVHPEPGNEYLREIMNMTPEDPAPESRRCSIW